MDPIVATGPHDNVVLARHPACLSLVPPLCSAFLTAAAIRIQRQAMIAKAPNRPKRTHSATLNSQAKPRPTAPTGLDMLLPTTAAPRPCSTTLPLPDLWFKASKHSTISVSSEALGKSLTGLHGPAAILCSVANSA